MIKIEQEIKELRSKFEQTLKDIRYSRAIRKSKNRIPIQIWKMSNINVQYKRYEFRRKKSSRHDLNMLKQELTDLFESKKTQIENAINKIRKSKKIQF